MTTYAIAHTVPDDCDYLTAGKRYRVEYPWNAWSFVTIDDEGDKIICSWRGCASLNGGDWTRIEIEGDDE